MTKVKSENHFGLSILSLNLAHRSQFDSSDTLLSVRNLSYFLILQEYIKQI